MNRRDFFKWLTGGAAVAVLPKSNESGQIKKATVPFKTEAVTIKPHESNYIKSGILEFCEISDMEGWASVPLILGAVKSYEIIEEAIVGVFSDNNYALPVKPKMEVQLYPMATFIELESLIGRRGYYKLSDGDREVACEGILTSLNITSGEVFVADLEIIPIKYFSTIWS